MKYSGVARYTYHAQKAILEMFRQTGHLKIHDGISFRGMMMRMLVLPENLNHTENVLRWISENMGTKTYISLMGQYYPAHNASDFNELKRGITKEEYAGAVNLFEEYGFQNGFLQDVGSSSRFTPDFRN